MKNLNGKTAVLYRRVSTTEQKNYGMSLSNQSEQLRSFCYRNNIEVVQDFEEDYSAKDFNRPVFSELLKFVAQNKNFVCRSSRNAIVDSFYYRTCVTKSLFLKLSLSEKFCISKHFATWHVAKIVSVSEHLMQQNVL